MIISTINLKETVVKAKNHDKVGYTDSPVSCDGDVLVKGIEAPGDERGECSKPKHVVRKARIKV